ncbi:hypothetical protein [Nocardioides sp. CFH 31398]|uniref:hypothetical protein n=1 Tax=Nocardioides sp. CFH 31398 TaxID=2919579 RepID=UPI001F053CC8|nr:hypothetical protein [Nocardioides sp. CFH 31398]MCH1867094.1 hypothetical protein [Nocardioides sp. CFH 31398]
MSESVGAQDDGVVDAEIVDVSPALAETWLSRNPNNRNLRRPVVDGYARDMEAGRWRLNGETLKFSADGQLYDGQHRLNAIVQSGATVPMVVVRGLTPDVMPTVDAGAKRTYSDALKLTGEENTATLAAVCRRAVMWERGMRTNTGAIRPTPLEMDDWLTRHPEIRNSADLANRLASRERLPASVIGLCHWLFSELDGDAATTFFLRVADGDGLAATDPIAVLRNRVTRLRLSGGRINETEGLALTIRAWNAHRDGETRTKLQMPRGGLTNENFPVPR